MKDKNKCSEQELFEKRVSEQLYKHREKLNLRPLEVADLVGKSYSAYQKWESTGKHLTNIYDILNVFQVLGFSIAEIVEVLGLPRPTSDDIKELCPDEDTRKSIEEDGIYLYVRKKCTDLDDSTIEKLLDVISAERLKRRNVRMN